MALPIVKEALNKQLSNEELKEFLESTGVTRDEFNSEMLPCLCDDSRYHRIKLDPAQDVNDYTKERSKAALSDEHIVNDVLQEFYKIDYCPSFLRHQAMLCDEDYKFALEIYSKIFSLSNNISGECWIRLATLLNEHGDKMLCEMHTSRADEDEDK